jgi:hypothetical protein
MTLRTPKLRATPQASLSLSAIVMFESNHRALSLLQLRYERETLLKRSDAGSRFFV